MCIVVLDNCRDLDLIYCFFPLNVFFRQQVLIALLVEVGVITADNTMIDYTTDDIATGLQVLWPVTPVQQ